MSIANFSEFESLNESILNIDFGKIKSEALRFSRSKEIIFLLSELDSDLLNKAISDIKKVLKKYGNNMDRFYQSIVKKLQSKNEGMASDIILSIFGFHSFVTLLSAIKNNWGVGKYFTRIWGWGRLLDDSSWSNFKSALISSVFLVFSIFYLVGSNSKIASGYYSSQDDEYYSVPFSWNGFDDYKYFDKSKEYDARNVGDGKFEILFKGEVIGFEDSEGIKKLDGTLVLGNSFKSGEKRKREDIPFVYVDLEKMLTKKINPDIKAKIDSIESHIEDEVRRSEFKIKDLRDNLYENMDQAKKLMSDASDNRKKDFEIIKEILERDNKLGYIGMFAKFIIHEWKDADDLYHIYSKIKQNSDILNKLRDPKTLEFKKVLDFEKYEDLDDALSWLKKWRKVNSFIQGFPPNQKKLLWEGGWFKSDLRNLSNYLMDSMIKIQSDDNLKKLFFRKISSLKDKKSILDSISSLTNNEPWEFDYWLSKLNSARNVIVTYAKDGNIICAVYTYSAIKKIGNGANWCIIRDKKYFDQYTSGERSQFIYYDFNKGKTDDNSIIGFTLSGGCVYTSHNKSDKNVPLPSKFTNFKYSSYYIIPEFVKIETKDVLKKVDRALWDVTIKKIRSVLNKNKIISNFIDWWGDEDRY